MIRSARYLLLAVLALLLLTVQLLPAESTPRLIERAESQRRGLPTLTLIVGIDREPMAADAQPTDGWRREERVLTDPTTGQEEVIVLEGPAPDLSLRSFLVAIPEGHALTEAVVPVRVDLFDPETGELIEDAPSVEAEVRPAQVGLVRAGQVFYRLPDLDRPIEARLSVDIATQPGPQNEKPSRIAVPRSVSTLFVNSNDAVVMTSSNARRSGTELLQPPGDIRITFTAEHRAYRANLDDLGLDPEEPGHIQILHHGTELPYLIVGDDVVFYTERRFTDSDIDDSVFITVVDEADSSPLMTTRGAFDFLGVPFQVDEVEVVRNRVFDWNLVYEPAMSTMPVASRFAFHRVAAGSTRIHQLPINDLLTNTFISLRVELHGRSLTIGFDPDHYADIYFGGVALPQVTWKGRTKRIVNFNFNLPVLPTTPVSVLELRHQIPTNTPVIQGLGGDEQYLDIVELTYLAKPRLENGQFGRLRLTAAGSPRRVTMGGFPVGTVAEDVLILDVTMPSNPVLVVDPIAFPDESGTVAITFDAPSSAAVYHIEYIDGLPSPISVDASETLPEPLLAGIPLRGIVVRDPVYAEAMQPWIAYRGPGIIEMCPQEAYNVFNGGQSSPQAIRDALAHLIESAEESVAVPFVLLVGHGSFDRKNYLGFKSAPWIPAFLEEGVVYNYSPETQSGTTIENAVDLWYGLLFGEDNLLDVSLTRWPARSPGDVERLIARSMAHDSIAHKLIRTDRPAVFLADNDSPAFVQDQAVWHNLWSPNGFSTLLMTRNQPVPSLEGLSNTAAIRMALDRRDEEQEPLGASFFFYTGHGNYDRWAGNMVTTFDIGVNPTTNPNLATFGTTNQWPVVATFTCLNGNYANPGATLLSMAEKWLFGSDHGAIANVAPTGVDFYNEQRLLQGAYLRKVGKANPVDRAMTVGDMSHRASVYYATQYPSLMKTLREYIVFGDPLALTTVVPQESELTVTLESSHQFVQIDEPFELTLTIQNIGIHEARGATVEVSPPVGYELLEIVTPWGEFTDWGELWEVNLGTLAPGQAAEIILTVQAKPEAITPGMFTAVGRSITTGDDETAMDTATVIVGDIPSVSESMSIY